MEIKLEKVKCRIGSNCNLFITVPKKIYSDEILPKYFFADIEFKNIESREKSGVLNEGDKKIIKKSLSKIKI